MTLAELKAAEKKVVGTKQTLKAVNSGNAIKVYIACDADPKVAKPVLCACEEQCVEVEEVEHMADLGRACSIKVGAAAAAIVKV